LKNIGAHLISLVLFLSFLVGFSDSLKLIFTGERAEAELVGCETKTQVRKFSDFRGESFATYVRVGKYQDRYVVGGPIGYSDKVACEKGRGKKLSILKSHKGELYFNSFINLWLIPYIALSIIIFFEVGVIFGRVPMVLNLVITLSGIFFFCWDYFYW